MKLSDNGKSVATAFGVMLIGQIFKQLLTVAHLLKVDIARRDLSAPLHILCAHMPSIRQLFSSILAFWDASSHLLNRTCNRCVATVNWRSFVKYLIFFLEYRKKIFLYFYRRTVNTGILTEYLISTQTLRRPTSIPNLWSKCAMVAIAVGVIGDAATVNICNRTQNVFDEYNCVEGLNFK